MTIRELLRLPIFMGGTDRMKWERRWRRYSLGDWADFHNPFQELEPDEEQEIIARALDGYYATGEGENVWSDEYLHFERDFKEPLSEAEWFNLMGMPVKEYTRLWRQGFPAGFVPEPGPEPEPEPEPEPVPEEKVIENPWLEELPELEQIEVWEPPPPPPRKPRKTPVRKEAVTLDELIEEWEGRRKSAGKDHDR